jgi:hypothetical protein
MAFELYAKQANNTEAERRACEIRLRAEDRGGKLLRSMQKSAGRKKPDSAVGNSEYREAIEKAGLSERQAERWQQFGGSSTNSWDPQLLESVHPLSPFALVDIFLPFCAAMVNSFYFLKELHHTYIDRPDPNNTGLEGRMRLAANEAERLPNPSRSSGSSFPTPAAPCWICRSGHGKAP